MTDTTFVPPAAPRILIADDSSFVRSSLAMQLASGFEVVAAARDAAEAVAAGAVAHLRKDVTGHDLAARLRTCVVAKHALS